MVDGDGSGEYFQFFELVVAIVFDIVLIDLSEELCVLFDFGDFFLNGFFPIDFLDLFGF